VEYIPLRPRTRGGRRDQICLCSRVRQPT
jgi:hypothetical protein